VNKITAQWASKIQLNWENSLAGQQAESDTAFAETYFYKWRIIINVYSQTQLPQLQSAPICRRMPVNVCPPDDRPLATFSFYHVGITYAVQIIWHSHILV
jgi:hypothetical protein